MKRLFRRHAAIAAALTALTIWASPMWAQNALDAPGLLSAQFVDDAKSSGRNVKIPDALAEQEALTLLEQAVRLDPGSTTALRLLAEAAHANGNFKLEQDSLLALSKLQPDNIAAQVQFMDALAQQRQTVADRIAVYQAALNNSSLDPQVQSAMALYIGRLYSEQGRTADASAMYVKAAQLNSANLAAWQELAHALVVQNAPDKDRLYALIQLLHCDPYQPEALAAGAAILTGANDYQQAANWTNAAIEQFQQRGQPLDPTLTENLAADWAITGNETLLTPYLKELLGLKQPSLKILLIALSNDTNGSYAAGNEAEGLLQQLHDQVQTMIQNDPQQQADLEADDIWLDLFYNSTLPSNIVYRVAQLGEKLKSDSTLFERLQGWLLLRQGHLDAASEQFQAAGNDPYSLLGLARIAGMKKDKDTAENLLQQIWDSHPDAIPALDTALEARTLGITLTQNPDEQALSGTAAAYPDQLLHAADDPSSIVQVTLDWENQFSTLGEPIYIDVRYFNASPYSLAVGPNTGVTTNVALAAASNGVDNTNLGAYAVDSDPQLLCLDPGNDMTIIYSVDQGVLRELLFNNPTAFFSGELQAITNPMATGTSVMPGLGGQQVDAGNFNVQGFGSGDPTALAQMTLTLPTLQANNQMLAAGTLACALAGLNANASSATADQQTLMNNISQAIVKLTTNLQAEPAQAWLARRAPLSGLPDNVTSAINGLISSPNASVRMTSYWRLLALAQAANDPSQLTATANQLASLAKIDKDPVASAYAQELSQQAALPPPPATAPTAATTQPDQTGQDQPGQ